jgi:membrane-associated phospholipid phosphatase
MTWHAASFLLERIAMVFAVAALFLLLMLLPHRGWDWLRGPARRVLHHPALAGLRRLLPGCFAFCERHFAHRGRSWLRLLLGAAFFVVGLRGFAQLLHAVLSDGRLVVADHRLHNTVALFRSPELHRFYSFITDLAGPVLQSVFVAAVALVLWVAGKRREAFFLGLALAGAGLFSVFLKQLVHRARPIEVQSFQGGFSFPSGHTLSATAVYGFLVYLLLRDPPRRAWHYALVVPPLALIGLVPLSRVYLGVHWPYDTVASLALGISWLSILITLYKFPPLERHLPLSTEKLRPWAVPALAGVSALLVGIAVVWGYRAPLPRALGTPLPLTRIPPGSVLQGFPPGLDRTSEDLAGGAMEPIAFLFLGTDKKIVPSFERAGWSLAETPSVRGLGRELLAVVADRPDPTGPATPAYYAGRPQDLTFERPGDATRSIRRRHHIRLWRTPLCLDPDCEEVWVATSSYDAGVELVPKPYLITHRIDPEIDRERTTIENDLLAAGAKEVGRIVVTGPRQGKNAGGDRFRTDGQACVIEFL